MRSELLTQCGDIGVTYNIEHKEELSIDQIHFLVEKTPELVELATSKVRKQPRKRFLGIF